MAGGFEDHLTKGGESASTAFVRPEPGSKSGAVGGPALGHRASPAAFGWQGSADHGASGAEHVLPGLQEEEPLPWLYSTEEDMDDAGVDPGRVWAFVLTGFALLALIVGGVWWTAHHRNAGGLEADGSLITALPGPIKEAPQDPGGKTFDGTGDSSFAVSQGHVPGATLAISGDQGADRPIAGTAQSVVAKPIAKDNAGADTALADGGSSPHGIGVQIGAYSSQLAAEAAWAHMAKSFDVLSGASHRIVEGKADIGTVYGLQAVTGSDAAANALCDKLKSGGLACQVKD
jgi:hypothetical protein